MRLLFFIVKHRRQNLAPFGYELRLLTSAGCLGLRRR
jgi:hypothetical protein